MDKIQVEKNIRIYMFYKFFIFMMIIGPVLTPFMISKGLNYTQIMMLQSVAAVTKILFEVPTGVVADKVSRKLSLFLSGLFLMAGLLIYIIFDYFAVLALAEVIMAVGCTLNSGADSALLYETLKGTEYEKNYSKYEAKSVGNVFLGQGIFSVLSSVFYTLNKNIPFAISIIFMLAASISSMFLAEPEREKSGGSYIVHIIENTKNIFKSKTIIWLTIFAICFGCSNMIGFWLYEPLFKAVNIPVTIYGLIFLGLNLVASFSAGLYSKCFSGSNSISSLIVLSMLMFVSFIIPGLFMNILIVPIIFVQQIFRALYGPIMCFAVNENTEDRHRATMISTISLLSNLTYAASLPFIGMVLDGSGPKTVYLTIGIISGLLIIFLFLSSTKIKTKKDGHHKEEIIPENPK